MKHVTITETDDITAAMQEARRNVAIAKLGAFESESLILGAMAQRKPHRKQELVDCLYDIATANNLLRIHGGSLIEALILAGLEAAR
jgi:hypothetical protein